MTTAKSNDGNSIIAWWNDKAGEWSNDPVDGTRYTTPEQADAVALAQGGRRQPVPSLLGGGGFGGWAVCKELGEFVGRVAWVSEVDGMGVVELNGDTWFGIDSLRFAFSALKGEKVSKGDRVKLTISGGRKAPVIQSMSKA